MQRLVLVDALERALADLGLVRRVGRVPLAAEQQLVDRRRRPVAVDAGAQERREVGPVPGGQPGQPRRQLELGLGLGQVERATRGARPGCPRRAGRPRSRPRAASIRSRSSAVWGPYGIGRSAGRDQGVVGRRRRAVRRAGRRRAIRTRSIQPAPYGSLLTSSGLPASSSLAAITSPLTGANRSLTALTDSTTPKARELLERATGVGQLDEDDVTELVGGVRRDPDRGLVALDADPLVIVGVAQVGRAPSGSGIAS